jgi:hypothetical protein
MAHRIQRDSVQTEKELIKVLQVDLMAELEHKLRTLAEGTRLADLLSADSGDTSGEGRQRAVLTLAKLVDEMLLTNSQVRETLLWLKRSVADLAQQLPGQNGSSVKKRS